MKEIIRRFLLESPTFFKRLQTVGMLLAGIGGALIVAQGQYADSVIISKIAPIAKELVAVGATIAAIAKLTVKNPDQL